ncbi:sigma factor-like helix-turn-helix DNA-binding protein [Fredinandcohnia humi]
MGMIKVNLSSKEKRLEDEFPLDRDFGIYALLSNIHHIREMRFSRGDLDASILLLDFEDSMNKTNLTLRQQQTIYLFFEKDLTQQEVAEILQISQQAVSEHLNNAIRRIAQYNMEREEEFYDSVHGKVSA